MILKRLKNIPLSLSSLSNAAIAHFSFATSKHSPLFDINAAPRARISPYSLQKIPNSQQMPASPPNRIDFQTLKNSNPFLESDIQNFDNLYSSIRKIQSHGKNRTNLQQTIYRFNVYEILKLKLGTNYDRILYFLRVRGENLTELELHYILQMLNVTGTFQKLIQENPDLDLVIKDRLSQTKFMTFNYILNILYIMDMEAYLQTESLKNLAKCFTDILRNLHRLIRHEDLLDALRTLRIKQFLGKLDIVDIVRSITRRFFTNLTDFSLAMEFLKLNDELDLLKIGSSMIKLEEVFIQYHHYITISEYAEILCILSRNKALDSFLFTSVVNELSQKLHQVSDLSTPSDNHTLTPVQFSMLCWSLSQNTNARSTSKVWFYLEDTYLNYLKSLSTDSSSSFDGESFSRIIQSFDNCSQGSRAFWLYEFEPLLALSHHAYFVKCGFADTMTLFYRRLQFDTYSERNFFRLISYEKSLKMEYIDRISFPQFKRTVYSYLTGLDYFYSNDSDLGNGKNIIDTSIEEFKTILNRKVNEFIEGMVGPEFRIIDANEFVQFFYVVFYSYTRKLIELTESTRISLHKELRFKLKKLKFEEMLKFTIFMSGLAQDGQGGRWDEQYELKAGELLKKGLVFELFEAIKLLIKYQFDKPYLWSVIELKMTEYCDTLSVLDFMYVGVLFQKKHLGSVDFWEFYKSLLEERLHFCSNESIFYLREAFHDRKDILQIIDKHEQSKYDEYKRLYSDLGPNYLRSEFIDKAFSKEPERLLKSKLNSFLLLES